MAEYMVEHPRASLDSAIFHVLKVAYAKGLADGQEIKPTNDIKDIKL